MQIADIFCQSMELPPGSLTGKERLSELEKWDSLALLNVMAALNSQCGITLSPHEILNCGTINDVELLLVRDGAAN